VLAQSAKMPSGKELPPDISGLAERNAIEISDHRFSEDVERLIHAVGYEKAESLRRIFGIQRNKALRFVASLLLCALGLAWLSTQWGPTREAIAVGWRAVRISMCSKCIPISDAAAEQLRAAISGLTPQLRANLKNAGQPDFEPWPLAQAVVAVNNNKDELSERTLILSSFTALAEPECECWREFPTHYLYFNPGPGVQALPPEQGTKRPLNVVATGWVLLAQASLNSPASPKTLEFLLAEQHPDGWWGIFPVDRDAKFASIYGTCWALIGLGAQLSAKSVPDDRRSAVENAIRRGTKWLLDTQHDARWRFYPLWTQSPIDSESLSGLALHTLHTVADSPSGLELIDREWMNKLPAPPEPDKSDFQLLNIDTKEGRTTDHFQQIRLPWLIVATVDAYPNGTVWDRARAVLWFEQAIKQADRGREPISKSANWWAAELLFALNYLQSTLAH